MVDRYVLNPGLAPPAPIEEILATGKVRYADAPDAYLCSSRVLHVLAPLDTFVPIGELWPARAHSAGLVRSATVYDLIPAADPATYLADAVERSRYRMRIELLKSCAQLQVLSRSVAGDLTRLLGVEPERCALVGAAPAAAFVPPVDRMAASRRVRPLVEGLTSAYVLYPTGHHPRKNNEALVTAWSMLPATVARGHQLVLAGDLPPSFGHHLEQLAASLGVPGAVVVTRYVDDDLLVQLYQGADLVCFPSLAEGYGLPVAEALACGAPVLASDLAPLDELVEPARRFDPTTPHAIAAALARALGTDPTAAEHAEPGPAVVTSWHDVAARTADAFDALLAAARADHARHEACRSRRTEPATSSTAPSHRHSRIAFVSPLPPAPTGIAAYTSRLLEALRDTGGPVVDAFCDGPTPGQRAPDGVELFHARSLGVVEAARGGYDAVVYALGNSHHHLGALGMLRRRRGVVLAHDVRLTNLYLHEHGDPALPPGGLARTIRSMYGESMPDHLGAGGAVDGADLERFGLLMAREVVAASDAFLVSSHMAAELAALDVGTALAARIAVLPFAVDTPSAERGGDLDGFSNDAAARPAALAGPVGRGWGSGPDVAGGRAVVAHFGIVDPAKEPELLLDAFCVARARHPGLLLAYVGPVSAAQAGALARRCAERGVEQDVVVTGGLGSAAYAGWLERATVAVQLRRTTNGEASAAVGECLASGVATIATDVGWIRELPDGAVARVPRAVGPVELGETIAALAGDEASRARLAAAGRTEAAARTFARVADALLAGLGERVARPGTGGGRPVRDVPC